MKTTRFFTGLVFSGGGAVLLCYAMRQPSQWIDFALGGPDIPAMDLWMMLGGAALALIGASLLQSVRRMRRRELEVPIDAQPVAEWVRDFERHQAELTFSRGHSVQSERTLQAIQLEEPYQKAS